MTSKRESYSVRMSISVVPVVAMVSVLLLSVFVGVTYFLMQEDSVGRAPAGEEFTSVVFSDNGADRVVMVPKSRAAGFVQKLQSRSGTVVVKYCSVERVLELDSTDSSTYWSYHPFFEDNCTKLRSSS